MCPHHVDVRVVLILSQVPPRSILNDVFDECAVVSLAHVNHVRLNLRLLVEDAKVVAEVDRRKKLLILPIPNLKHLAHAIHE